MFYGALGSGQPITVCNRCFAPRGKGRFCAVNEMESHDPVDPEETKLL